LHTNLYSTPVVCCYTGVQVPLEGVLCPPHF